MIKSILTLVLLTSLSVAQTKDELHQEIANLKKEIKEMKTAKHKQEHTSTRKYKRSNYTYGSSTRHKLYKKKMKRLED